MAHFQGFVHGNRGTATRLGTKASGMVAFARGWQGGASIHITYSENHKHDHISITAGPHGDLGERTLYRGCLDQLLEGGVIVIDTGQLEAKS